MRWLLDEHPRICPLWRHNRRLWGGKKVENMDKSYDMLNELAAQFVRLIVQCASVFSFHSPLFILLNFVAT
jgi:hypothetical protein